MSATIQIKRSSTPGKVPSGLSTGELAINITDGKLYFGSGSEVRLLATSGSTGGGGGGTVTSIAAGTGMSFTTITSTGNVNIDTTKVPYISAGFSSGFLKWNGSAWVFDAGSYTSPLTTKGDIFVRNSSTDTRLAVGSNDQVLIADSSAATGLKWGTVPSPIGYLSTSSFNQWTGSNLSQFAGTSSYATTASYALNGGLTINPGVSSVPYNAGGVFADTPITYDGDAITSFIDFGFNISGPSSILRLGTNLSSPDIFGIDINTNPSIGTIFIGDRQGLYGLVDLQINSHDGLVKTTYNNTDAGLKLDFAGDNYVFGYPTESRGVWISGHQYTLGETSSSLYIDPTKIRTGDQDLDRGLYIDFPNNQFSLIDPSNGNGGISIDTGDVAIKNHALNGQSIELSGNATIIQASNLQLSGLASSTQPYALSFDFNTGQIGYTPTSSFGSDSSGLLSTASFNAWTGSNASQFAGTASYASRSISASQALTASYVNPLRQNVTITGSLLVTQSYISSVDYIDFDTASVAPTWKSGRIFWDNTDGALAVYNAEADITLQVGQEEWIRVRNDSGATITNGSAVRLQGSHGDAPQVVLAQALAVSGSAGSAANQIIGIATHDIEHASFGYVTTRGLIHGLYTNNFTEGNMLFVSTSAGQLTSIAPQPPYEIITIGACVRQGPGTSGIIYVDVQQPIDFSYMATAEMGTYHYGDLWTYALSGSVGVWKHTNQLSGSYSITGSLTISGSSTFTNIGPTILSGSVTAVAGITGSLQGTASFAATASYVTASVIIGSVASASYAQTASYLNSLTQTIINTGSVIFTGNSSTIGGSRNALYLKNSNNSGNQSSIIQFGSAGTAQTWALITDLNADGTTINQLDFYNTPLGNTALSLKSNGSAQFLNSVTASTFVGALAGTASWSTNALTSSYVNTLDQQVYVSNTSQPTNFTSTAALYTDGGLRVTKDAYVSGTLYLNNLTVYGTQSVVNITSSQLNISTNLITVNTATPTVRFGGLAVYDSGSTGKTGSMLWDSQNDVWLYSNPAGASYDGAMMLVGPRNSTGIGNEVGINSWYAAIGNGSHHMTSSQIYNSGSLIRLETNTEVTGTLNVSLGITSSLFGTSSWANNAITASYITSSNIVGTVTSASYAATTSLAPNYVLNSQTSSFATTGSNSFNGSQRITGSLIVSGSGATIELYGDKIIAGAVGGDEGGEILLGKPITNTTLTGSGITIDSYQNKIRIFEQGGAARGAYIDITACAGSVGTNLLSPYDWTDWSNSANFAGWASTTTRSAQYKKIDAKTFVMQVFVEGTGTGGASATIALPFTSSAWGTQVFTNKVVNSGTTAVAASQVLANSTTLTCYATIGNGNWSANLTRNVYGTFMISIA